MLSRLVYRALRCNWQAGTHPTALNRCWDPHGRDSQRLDACQHANCTGGHAGLAPLDLRNRDFRFYAIQASLSCPAVQLAGWHASYGAQSLLGPTLQRIAAVGCVPACQLHRGARWSSPLDLRNRDFRFYAIQASLSCPAVQLAGWHASYGAQSLL